MAACNRADERAFPGPVGADDRDDRPSATSSETSSSAWASPQKTSRFSTVSISRSPRRRDKSGSPPDRARSRRAASAAIAAPWCSTRRCARRGHHGRASRARSAPRSTPLAVERRKNSVTMRSRLRPQASAITRPGSRRAPFPDQAKARRSGSRLRSAGGTAAVGRAACRAGSSRPSTAAAALVGDVCRWRAGVLHHDVVTQPTARRKRPHDLERVLDAVAGTPHPAPGGRCARRRSGSFWSSGASTPAIMLNSVVLPAPFGPITARISPGATAKLTLSTASSPRKRLLTSATDSRGQRRAPPDAQQPRGATATRRSAGGRR